MNDTPKTIKERRRRVAKKGFIKRRQAPIEEVRRRYEFIVNTSREFLSLINRQHKYVEVNTAFCMAHQLKREEIIGHPVSSIWGEDVFNAVIRKHLERCFEGHEVNYVNPFRFASLGVRTMDVTYYPYQDRTGGVTHVVVVSRDVTAEKRQEEELLSLKKAVETMQLGVTICNPAGKIQYTNPADARMHGYTVDELTGRDVKFFAPPEFWKKRTIRNLKEISSWSREGVNVRKDGTLFPVQLMSDVVKRHDGRPIGIVTTCEDITVRKRLFNDLQQSNIELSHAYERTLDGWVRALDLRDKETEGHSHRVADITVRLARTIGLSDESIVHVRRGALLHDIGKMGIPDDILHKAGPLSEDEWKVMKLHPVYAYEMLTPISFLQQAIDIPYCHHEKWDGSGYPRGLRGEQIPLAARLFSIADIWDALRSDRPYRPAWPEEKVREYMQSLSETHFEPGIIDLFMQTDF